MYRLHLERQRLESLTLSADLKTPDFVFAKAEPTSLFVAYRHAQRR